MRHLRRRAAPAHRWLAALHTLANQPDTGPRLLHQALASMAVQVLSAAALAAGAWALGVQAAWPAWAFAMAPIFLLAALPVSVGGWGTREAAAVLALAPFGVDAAGAVGRPWCMACTGWCKAARVRWRSALAPARNKRVAPHNGHRWHAQPARRWPAASNAPL